MKVRKILFLFILMTFLFASHVDSSFSDYTDSSSWSYSRLLDEYHCSQQIIKELQIEVNTLEENRQIKERDQKEVATENRKFIYIIIGVVLVAVFIWYEKNK